MTNRTETFPTQLELCSCSICILLTNQSISFQLLHAVLFFIYL